MNRNSDQENLLCYQKEYNRNEIMITGKNERMENVGIRKEEE